ncbi:unnamed protein product, partial [Gongylonema pulchrum]|uniref:Group II intron reverse transcriptase/maturase n=1 Tax=Gongylonema pulchrum TaxID=637853 RepID=A0A183DZN5_9BILA
MIAQLISDQKECHRKSRSARYMGNLSPDEILKHIEGDNKGKTKGGQKSGANASK